MANHFVLSVVLVTLFAPSAVQSARTSLRAHAGGPTPPASTKPDMPQGDAEPLEGPMQRSGPEQGFQGKQVQHDNMTSYVGNWTAEYGPNATHNKHTNSHINLAGAKVSDTPAANGSANDSDPLKGPMKRNAPEQGFQGEDVQHDNHSSYTGNWSAEYGPNATHNKHPNSDINLVAAAAPAAAAPAPGPAPAANPLKGPMQLNGPEQGFQGKQVEHDNLKTYTGNWSAEYGPNAPHNIYNTKLGLLGSAAPAPAPAPGPAPEVNVLKGPMQLNGPEQGFQGEDVEHDNLKTYTGNWSSEYGPNAPHNIYNRNLGLLGAKVPAPAPAPGPAPAVNVLKGPMQLTGPEQGFQGEDVQHENLKTYSGNWSSEYGPAAPHNIYNRNLGLLGAKAPAPAPAPDPAPAVNVLKGPMQLNGPEQGFHGEDVQHENLKTFSGNWSSEYGPSAPHNIYNAHLR